MSEDHTTIQQNSDHQDAKREENSGPKTELEDIDEGYQTPTSEEHKIPESVRRCPPPAPKKRKRLFVDKKNMRKVEVFKGTLIMDAADLELFFKSFERRAALPAPGAVPEPDPDPECSPKKRHI